MMGSEWVSGWWHEMIENRWWSSVLVMILWVPFWFPVDCRDSSLSSSWHSSCMSLYHCSVPDAMRWSTMTILTQWKNRGYLVTTIQENNGTYRTIESRGLTYLLRGDDIDRSSNSTVVQNSSVWYEKLYMHCYTLFIYISILCIYIYIYIQI